MIWSFAPASSAATSFESSSCVLTRRLSQLLTHQRAHPLAVGATLDLGHHDRHDLAHLAGRGSAGLRDRVAHDRRELLLGELLRQVRLDELGLALLSLGQLGPPA